jgi:predicted transcriptional regulator
MNFSEDDWLIDIIFQKKKIRHQLFIVKNYNMNILNEIIFDLIVSAQKIQNLN